ncbi:RagB/SusD family nutrient uptake outer membrane protein [Flavobacterium rakeshii]|uniref:RagB/SusD family nutrient uptake outer membrane protein n=1 Tax=Flavobacterium rakeshii TaxID=1038845 RepID=UPI002E7B2A95|nr:RagB/SusD family nutrient uptake outer membrane protein [Flavobacterium rakeshii]MEE1899253.1 RagB/SusD family nutrient uptake outer membrane protein [Flavobacterium rakeshii]
MKKILRISLLAAFIGMMSCEDATDIIQESELSEELAFQTVDDLRGGLIGVYAVYSPDAGGNGSGDQILFNDLFTDNLKRGISSSGQGNQTYNFILQPGSNFPTTLWNGRYAVINFSNRVLRAWERVYPTLETEAERDDANEIKAQLLAFRGFCHFELIQYFATNYQDLTAPGVIVMDFVPEVDQVFPRNTVGEVFQQIESDLTQAAQLMGTEFNSLGEYTTVAEESKFYINPDVITAMRARVKLFEGNYTEAYTLANSLLQNENYGLSGYVELGSLYESDNLAAKELIFALSRRQGDNTITSLWSANGAGVNGSPFFEISNGLLNILPSSDVRRFIILNADNEIVGLNSPNNILPQGKYLGATEDGAMLNDVKVFRAAEMVLIRAEAQARLGNLNAAATDIKALRDIRVATNNGGNTPLPSYANLNAALTDILLERRKEFALEGHRYLDLKRIGTEIGVGINRESVDCASFGADCDLAPTSYKFTLPIPNSEISANPTIAQNPGY